MQDKICDVFLAIRFETVPTKTKAKPEWVRVDDNPIKHIKRLAKINQDDYWDVFRLLISGAIYAVGKNQYKLFKEKERIK